MRVVVNTGAARDYLARAERRIRARTGAVRLTEALLAEHGPERGMAILSAAWLGDQAEVRRLLAGGALGGEAA